MLQGLQIGSPAAEPGQLETADTVFPPGPPLPAGFWDDGLAARIHCLP